MGRPEQGLRPAREHLAADGDEVFRQLVLARIIEPTSKLDSLRVLEETGVAPASYRTLKRHLPAYATEAWRERLAALCACHVGLGPATLLLYDVTTMYFETDTGDGFRESGFSKECRLEPQITVGLLTNAAGFPLMVNAFEGNKAEPTTMLPAIKAFMAAHRLHDVVIVADAGMISEKNMKDIEAAVKRNRFVKLTGATKTVHRGLETKAHGLAGIKGYVTNIADPTPEQVIGAYHQLFQIEKTFRMAKSDLAARPIYHRTKDSIEAHLTIVFAALAVSRWIEDTTAWSIKKFVKTVRRYRTIQIQAGDHVITAADPLPDDVHQTLEAIKTRAAAH